MKFLTKNKSLLILIPILLFSIFLLFRAFQSSSISPRNEVSYLDDDVDAGENPIVIYGDTRTNHDVHRIVVNNILEFHPLAVFHSGDLVSDGNSVSDWEIFNDITEVLTNSTDFYPALGNHEKNSQLYYDNFDLPNNEQWYSVDYNNIHFIILDSNIGLETGDEQHEWLLNDLENNTAREEFTIAIFHHPIFSTGPHGYDEANIGATLLPLLEEYDIDATFSGHDHVYERSYYNGIYFITAGSGGAPLYDQASQNEYSQKFLKSYNFCVLEKTGNTINVTVYDEKVEEIDSFEINP